jgi:hypothetical protein
MKRNGLLVFALVITMLYVSSCARGISPYEAANGKAKCGRNVR